MATLIPDPENIQQFDYSVDVTKAILWQYNNALKLQSILNAKNSWYAENQEQFWEDWFTNVFNLATANDFGCAVWGIILGLPLSFSTGPQPLDKPTFGFDSFNENFDNGNFTDPDGSGSIYLTTANKRILLQLRYFQLVTCGAVPEINRFLKYLFGNQGACYLLDGQNMTQTYVFRFNLDPNLLSVIQEYDLLPRPAGVGSRIILADEIPFGFDGFNENFDNGTFLY